MPANRPGHLAERNAGHVMKKKIRDGNCGRERIKEVCQIRGEREYLGAQQK
jgi:hypothetical protein